MWGYAKYIIQNMAADAILHGATLQPTSFTSSFPSFASGPQLISMNIHYSMIFLLPQTIPGTFHNPLPSHLTLPNPLPQPAHDSTLFVGSLIYNYDRQSEGSLLPTPFHSAIKAFRLRMLLEFQNLPLCLLLWIQNLQFFKNK